MCKLGYKQGPRRRELGKQGDTLMTGAEVPKSSLLVFSLSVAFILNFLARTRHKEREREREGSL